MNKTVILPSAPKEHRSNLIDTSRVPTIGPYKAYIGNISYETSEADLEGFFKGLEVSMGCNEAFQVSNCPFLCFQLVAVQIQKGNEGKPRGFGYAEFVTRDALIKALNMNEQPLNSRPLRISVPDDSRDNKRNQSGSYRAPGEPDKTEGDWRGDKREIPYKEPYQQQSSYGRMDSNRGFGARNGEQSNDTDSFRSYDGGRRGFEPRDQESRGGFRNFDNNRGFDQNRGFENRADDRAASDRQNNDMRRGFENMRNRSDQDRGFKRSEEPRSGGFDDSNESFRRDPAAGRYSDEPQVNNRSNDYHGMDNNRRNFERPPPGIREPYPDRSSGPEENQEERPRQPDRYQPPMRQSSNYPEENDRYREDFRRPHQGSDSEHRHEPHQVSDGQQASPSEPERPKERPKFKFSLLKQEVLAPSAEETTRPSIFGDARPVDTMKKELEIEEKLKATTISTEPELPADDARPRRVSTGSNSSGSKPRKISESDSHRSIGGGSSYREGPRNDDFRSHRDERRDDGYGPRRQPDGVRRPVPPPYDERRVDRRDDRRDDRRGDGRRTFNERPPGSSFSNNNNRRMDQNGRRDFDSHRDERPRFDRPRQIIERPPREFREKTFDTKMDTPKSGPVSIEPKCPLYKPIYSTAGISKNK